VDDDAGLLDALHGDAVPRPKTPSIWDSSTPRRNVPADVVPEIEVVSGLQSIKAERMPIRAEPKLVAADVAAARSARPAAATGTVLPSIRATLPPGPREDS
jgi:hypothetical protein